MENASIEADIDALQERLGHRFALGELLSLALTHSSWVNEFEPGGESNERLEFLGDAVLELCVSEELYARFPREREGWLTRLRARLVREPSLAAMARRLNLPPCLRLGRGEEAQGGRDRDSLLADALEAVFGALFLDGGYHAAKACVRTHFRPLIPDRSEAPRSKDFKTLLQETTQRLFRRRPVYTQVDMRGPDHEKVYVVAAILPDGRKYLAEGPSRKKAEQAAAAVALAELTPKK